MDQAPRTPNIVASTAETYCCSISESRSRETTAKDGLSASNIPLVGGHDSDRIFSVQDDEVNYFKSAQW
jgi:hypothetical protein